MILDSTAVSQDITVVRQSIRNSEKDPTCALTTTYALPSLQPRQQTQSDPVSPAPSKPHSSEALFHFVSLDCYHLLLLITIIAHAFHLFN